MFQSNIVQNGTIHQEVQWNISMLRYNEFPNYIIRYADSEDDLFRRKSEFSSDPNITLKLTFGTSNITYHVTVAVRHTEEQERGDYSNTVSIAYTSESTHTGCLHYNMYVHVNCAISQNLYYVATVQYSTNVHHITSNKPHSSWSTSRPDICQQNLSQYHISVVTT